MKKCSYCGRSADDQQTLCKGCGSGDFLITSSSVNMKNSSSSRVRATFITSMPPSKEDILKSNRRMFKFSTIVMIIAFIMMCQITNTNSRMADIGLVGCLSFPGFAVISFVSFINSKFNL
jgi:uncharacterized membrane protein YvbJ